MATSDQRGKTPAKEGAEYQTTRTAREEMFIQIAEFFRGANRLLLLAEEEMKRQLEAEKAKSERRATSD